MDVYSHLPPGIFPTSKPASAKVNAGYVSAERLTLSVPKGWQIQEPLCRKPDRDWNETLREAEDRDERRLARYSLSGPTSPVLKQPQRVQSPYRDYQQTSSMRTL